MALSGTYGGTAGTFSFEYGDLSAEEQLRGMLFFSSEFGVTSSTVQNFSVGTASLSIHIPGIHRETGGVRHFQDLFAPLIGHLSTVTFSLHPNGIKEAYVTTPSPGVLYCSFGASSRLAVSHSHHQHYRPFAGRL